VRSSPSRVHEGRIRPAHFLALAEKQRATVPLVIGHRLMGTSLAYTGDLTEGRAHYDKAVTLYNPDTAFTLIYCLVHFLTWKWELSSSQKPVFRPVLPSWSWEVRIIGLEFRHG
jgi:hypothetical protein